MITVLKCFKCVIPFDQAISLQMLFNEIVIHSMRFGRTSSSSGVKNLTANTRDVGLIPGSGISPGEGNGNPLWYSCLGNPMDRGAWGATVHGVARVSMTEQLNKDNRRS